MQLFKDEELFGKLAEKVMVIVGSLAGIGAIWYPLPNRCKECTPFCLVISQNIPEIVDIQPIANQKVYP